MSQLIDELTQLIATSYGMPFIKAWVENLYFSHDKNGDPGWKESTK